MASTWACAASAWYAYEIPSLLRTLSMMIPLLRWTRNCLEFGKSQWGGLSTARMVQHFHAMTFGHGWIDWTARSLQLCWDKTTWKPPGHVLVGYCGTELFQTVRLRVAGPLRDSSTDEVVLCTHTAYGGLGGYDVFSGVGSKEGGYSLLLPMIRAWKGPISIAVFFPEEDDFGPSGQEADRLLRNWMERLEEEGLGANVVLSSVGPFVQDLGAKIYDRTYPANILRQAAIDASPGDLVLLVDPGFVPSLHLHSALKSDAALGLSVRGAMDILSEKGAAMLVSSFVLFDDSLRELGYDSVPVAGKDGSEEQAADVSAGVDLQELRRLVDLGAAVSFDNLVCARCRSFAWQWVLMDGDSSSRFRQLNQEDLHHPAWLVRRSQFPSLAPYLHGLVGSSDGRERINWLGLPTGLMSSALALQAKGTELLLLPGHFIYRLASTKVPRNHLSDIEDWPSIFLTPDFLLGKFQETLPKINGSSREFKPLHEVLVTSDHRPIEILPQRSDRGWLLKRGHDSSLNMLVMASQLLGAKGLDIFLSSLPWTVHAVAVGEKDYWQASLEELPRALRQLYAPDDLVAIVDAYDAVLFPCKRSLAEEFAKFDKDIVWGAEKVCFPTRTACLSCSERYGSGTAEEKTCQAFPNLNGGCVMGRAEALAQGFEWMREKRKLGLIGRDDQENKMHFYNHHQDRVALDHQQRLFNNFFATPPETFRVEGCSVVSDITGEVCFAHGNGGTKAEILAPLLRQLEEKGCRQSSKMLKASSYAGISQPSLIWSTNN
eukprot:TRINITY_DN19628_c3_g1_i1.p1 TRINITY_DN19628_c3_g1~~TRINITY_DN19628_c3_g1_i1.p1  ORF type:complete len:783 (-),score=105.55 TRINITY_DN19628_c3_g1_i1:339-2657(-)